LAQHVLQCRDDRDEVAIDRSHHPSGYHAQLRDIDPLDLLDPVIPTHIAQRDPGWAYHIYRDFLTSGCLVLRPTSPVAERNDGVSDLCIFKTKPSYQPLKRAP
jgi:hypothetical protein